MMAPAYQAVIMRALSTQIHKRGVAQPGSAPPWGGGGRRFKSSRPDHSCYSPASFLPYGSVSLSVTCTCGWLAHNTVVIPAEARIQALNRTALRARDSEQRCAGGSAPAPGVPFFARAKKGTKESTPRSLRRPNNGRSPARRASAGRSPNSPGAGKRASGSIKSLATTPGLARCSARDTGGLANHLKSWCGGVF
jgi:hypothetical protein